MRVPNPDRMVLSDRFGRLAYGRGGSVPVQPRECGMAKRLAVLLAMAAATFLTTTGVATAGPVTIDDAANILDSGQVTTAGNALSDPVKIYTVNAFPGGSTAFDNEARKHVTGATDVVIAINTKPHEIAIRTGSNSHIRDTSAAISAFKSGYGTGNYTGATVAALQSLATTLNQAGGTNATGPQASHSSSRGHIGLFGILCPVIIIGLIVAAVVAVFRRRGRGGGGFGGGAPGGYGPGGPGYGDPGYGGGGYGPGYGRGGGIGPGMAGGIGAVGGGLLGYELGKMEGRDEERDRDYDRGGYDQGGYQGDQQFGGGGGDSYFGGDSGGGFDGGGGGFDGGGGGGDSSF
ncbi:hypothetical protein ABIA39_003797 [Nocardia sp. GAS34]